MPFKRGDILSFGTTPNADLWCADWDKYRGAIVIVESYDEQFNLLNGAAPFGWPWRDDTVRGLGGQFFTKIGEVPNDEI